MIKNNIPLPILVLLRQNDDICIEPHSINRYEFYPNKYELPLRCVIKSLWFDTNIIQNYQDLKWRLCFYHNSFGALNWESIEFKYISELMDIYIDTRDINLWFIELINESDNKINFKCNLFILKLLTN